MKKPHPLFLCVLLLCVPVRFVSPLDEPPDEHEASRRGAGETILSGIFATAEIMASNAVAMSFNHFILHSHWALPTAESIRKNFSEPWEWEETDGFKVNNIGHPIQGSVYFSAGRANGFNFYESLFFSSLGSFTWEVFSEGQTAAVNDFILASLGGLSMGEILYRLYLEACAAGVPAPITLLFNPAATVQQLITRKKPMDSGGNLRLLQFNLGMGYAQTDYFASNGIQNKDVFAFRGFIGDVGVAAIYGDPFIQNSRIPFEHFEFAMSFGLNPADYIDIRTVSDGYLFSFSPVHTGTDMMSTGLTLHFDFVSLGKLDIFDSTIDQFSNALDWTIKYQHLFSGNTAFQTKFHAGVTFFGVSEYYSPGVIYARDDLKNYGGGLNSKLFVNLEHTKLGKLNTGILGYVLWTYPGTSALSEGTVFWLFVDAAWSYRISKYFSVGISDHLALEWGLFRKSGFYDSQKINNAVKLFVALNL